MRCEVQGERRVRRLPVAGTGGAVEVVWDGRDELGRRTPAGVYFYRLVTSQGTWTRRLVRLP